MACACGQYDPIWSISKNGLAVGDISCQLLEDGTEPTVTGGCKVTQSRDCAGEGSRSLGAVPRQGTGILISTRGDHASHLSQQYGVRTYKYKHHLQDFLQGVLSYLHTDIEHGSLFAPGSFTFGVFFSSNIFAICWRTPGLEGPARSTVSLLVRCTETGAYIDVVNSQKLSIPTARMLVVSPNCHARSFSPSTRAARG